MPPQREPWPADNVDRWRAALVGYQASVKRDRVVFPIGAASVPFAVYFNAMHERIHPLFHEWFLQWLDTLPATDPMNAPDLHTRAEIVIDRSGRVVRTGVVRTSGDSAFDQAVLESIDRAQPLAAPPTVILSADGNAYMHWVFYRDETCSCSTMGSRPFVMR